MKKIVTCILLIIGLATTASAQNTGCCASNCPESKNCADTTESVNRTLVLTSIEKLKDAYINQDMGFLMEILDVDQSTMTDLYNEFMDEDITNVEIQDIAIDKVCGKENTLKSSFKLMRGGYNFSDSKHVTLLWDLSHPNYPRITEVTVAPL